MGDDSPGQRLGFTGAVNGNYGNSSQTWSKRLGNLSHAVLFMSTGPETARFSLPFENISSDFSSLGSSASGRRDVGPGLCIRDLYTKNDIGPVDPTRVKLEATVLPHDSAFFCVRPAVA